jgi:hypothetical protein
VSRVSGKGVCERSSGEQMISKSNLLQVGLIVIFSGIASAQNFPPARQASDFNVEISNLLSTKYVGSVPAGGQHSGLYGNGNLRRVADWQPSAEAPFAASVLRVEFWLEQDAIRIEVQAYLGEIPPNSRPPDWEKLQKIKIASRLVRVDETVGIDEARRVGIEPFQFKVVRAAPWSVGPPEIVNKTQALNVEATTEERPAYTVTVRNVSTKNISAIEWYGTENDRKGGGGGEQSASLIPAGRPFQINQHFSNSPEKDESKPEQPRRRQIVIAAVLFEDGSFEGEPDEAAEMAASWTGDALQLSRIIPLLQTAATSTDQDQAGMLTKLKTEVEALSDDVDPEAVAKVLTHFPKLSEETQRIVTIRLKAGLGSARRNLLSEIQRVEYQRAHAADTDVRTWLGQIIRKYEKVRSPYL